MDIKLVLTKFVAYLITSSVMTASYLILLYYLKNNFGLLVLTVVPLSFFCAFYFRPISDFLITSAKRKFFKGYYESDKVLKQVTHMLQFQTDRKQMLLDTLKVIDDALEVEHTGVLIAVRDEADQIIRYDHIQKDRVTGLPLDSGLIQELSRHYNILSFNDLPPEIQLQFVSYKLKSGLIVPLHSPEVLEGALILGQKGTQKAYTEEDNTLLFEVQTVVTSLFYKLTPYEKLQAEFMKTKQQLIEQDKTLARTEKIASLARVIQEYNHEIKTPLSILGLTVRRLKEGDDLEAFKSDMNQLIARANDIVETTLRISKPREHQDVPVDLIEVIQKALQQFPPDGVQLIKQFETVPDMAGDPDDLNILFANLFKNAYEAMQTGGVLTIRAYTQTENYTTYACVEVKDTGIGIPPENMERIWDPFFSTHVTKGRGLGLSLAFRIAREHLGSIQVKSTVGQGSTFKVLLKAKGG